LRWRKPPSAAFLAREDAVLLGFASGAKEAFEPVWDCTWSISDSNLHAVPAGIDHDRVEVRRSDDD
jgi:hypothetical protein